MAQATTLLQQFHFVVQADDGHRYVVDGMRTKSAKAWYVAVGRDDEQVCALNFTAAAVPGRSAIIEAAQQKFEE